MGGLNMSRRHQHLASRKLCEATWPSEVPGHEHKCKVFSGHANKTHVCRCGSSTRASVSAKKGKP